MTSKPGRNDRCDCGSGKKYKHCCGREAPVRPGPAAAPGPRIAPNPSVPPIDSTVIARVAALANSGRYTEMQTVAHELIEAHPNSGFAWKALGVSLQMQGNEALPALERAAALLPNDADCHSNLGSALRRLGRLSEAAVSYQRALAIKPLVAEIWNNLGNLHKELGQFEDAFRAYAKALELKPHFAQPHNNLGSAYQLLGRLEEAAASYRRALALDAVYADAHVNLGVVLRQQNRAAAALESCRRALELNSGLAAAWRLRAELHSDLGEFAAAEEALQRALAIEPDSAETWAGFAGLRRMTREDGAWLAGAQRVAARCVPAQEVYLRYALGKYFDDVGEYGQAFDQYRRANELAATSRPRHDLPRLSLGIDSIIREYGREGLARMASANPREQPVFIVGMPRSGTTLAQQILAAHPAVFGAGELSFWNTAFATLEAARIAGAATEARADLLRTLADEYLAELHGFSAGAARIVDKMPGNFLYLGVIHAALPKARMIHMHRHPIDTCLSIYFQNFGAVHPYANDLDDLAHYYREYLRILDHWRSILPPQVLMEVPYEKLVQDPEPWTRRILEFVGVPWDAACMEFHEGRRQVSTFSKWQVRQKISTSSVERWRHYENFIGPSLRALDTRKID